MVGPGEVAQVCVIKDLCVKQRPYGALSALAFLGECQKQAWSRSRWHSHMVMGRAGRVLMVISPRARSASHDAGRSPLGAPP